MPLFVPNTLQATEKTLSLVQSGGTYDVFTANGDCLIVYFVAKTGTAASGLTSILLGTNNTSALSILGLTLLAVLGADKLLAQVNSPFILENGKKIQITQVGTGTGGTMLHACAFMPLVNGAFLS